MSTTIPYSPSLVLGSIVEPAAMDNLLAISAAQTPMVEYAEGNASKSMVLFEQACKLARGTFMANILLFGHTWLALIDGRNPSIEQLAPSGQWVQATREGRFVSAMLLNKPYWAIAQSKQPVLLGTAETLLEHAVSDVGRSGHVSYAQHLPLPV